MSSIEPYQDRALVAFYHKNLSGLQDKGLFPETAPGAASYWRRREWRPLERKDFEIGLGNADEAGATLDRFWAGGSPRGAGEEARPAQPEVPQSGGELRSLVVDLRDVLTIHSMLTGTRLL